MSAPATLSHPTARDEASAGRERGGSGRKSNLTLSALGLRLAVGGPADLSDVDGDELLELLVRERLAVLAWLSSGAAIRWAVATHAAAEWRALWADAVRRGSLCMDAYAESAELLERSGVAVVALKGAPLSEMLYGDPMVRCSDDFDCFVTGADRERTASLLESNGWRLTLGDIHGDQTFERELGDVTARLELHSSLVSPRLAHLHVGRADSELRAVAGRPFRALAGPLLPAYLATHLATHTAPPLLWWLDLHLLWARLSGEERASAVSAARAVGLHRYLAWGVLGTESVSGALAGDDGALRGLGVRTTSRVDRHELWRHVALAPSPRAAGRAVAAWVRPPWAAERDGGVVSGTLRRAVRHARLLPPQRIPYAPRPPASRDSARRPGPTPMGTVCTTVSAAGFLEAARGVTACGGELAVQLSGGSMSPTMNAGDRVLLGPPPARLRPGAVVLIELAGRPVIHRVLRIMDRGAADDFVQTIGDACAIADAPVPMADVVARVVAWERRGSWTSQGLTFRFGAMALARGLRALLRLRLVRLRRRYELETPPREAAGGARITDDVWT